VVGFLCHCLPLGQIVRSLLFNVCLRVDSVLAGKLLRNWILDFDCLDGFRKVGKRVAPTSVVSRARQALECRSAYHSVGGMTLTIPDFMPYLSILSMKRRKLRNWSIVCSTTLSARHCRFAQTVGSPPQTAQAPIAAWQESARYATYRFEDRNFAAVPVMVGLDVLAVVAV
jgi:hypothetical protein